MNEKHLSIKHIIFRTIFALLTGSLGTLAFSPYDLWPTAIISLMGLLIVSLNCNHYQASYFSWIWGIGFFGTGIKWIYISINQFYCNINFINYILMTILIIYLSLYPAMFSIFLAQQWPYINSSRLVFAAPPLWTIIEFLRGNIFNGFPWLQFGYSQIDGPLKGVAPILGVEGITFILMMISGLFTLFLFRKQSLFIIISTSILFISLWCLNLIRWFDLKFKNSIVITLVQGNINQFANFNINYISQILSIYLKHSLSNIQNSQIIIWPETVILHNELIKNYFLISLRALLKQYHVSLITGIIDLQKTTLDNYHYYNSIIVIDNAIPDYYNNNRYTKYNLVPFGETIPLKRFLQKYNLFHNFQFHLLLTPGKYLQPQLIASNIKFTPVICYEIIFGNRIRENFRSDTDFLLTLSNNIWFGNSSEPWQHFQIARMRAIELGRPLIHGTNNGITGIIDANGNIQKTLPQFMEAILTTKITPTTGLTPYARLGPYSLWMITAFFGIISLKNHKTN